MNEDKKLIQNSSDKPNPKTRQKYASLLKKAVITALFLSSLSFIAITSVADTHLKTVFHVYMNDEFIGTVSDKNVIEDVVNTRVNNVKEKYKDYNIELGNKITYVPEQVFRPQVDDEQTVEKIESSLSIKADAATIVINDQPVIYVKNPAEANQVIEKLKLQYVSKKELMQVEMQKKSKAIHQPIKKNQTRLLDVALKEKVSIQETEIDPSKIISEDQAVNYLLKGTKNEKIYKVKKGDVLGSIAKEHHLTTKDLIKLNPELEKNKVLQIGQKLTVTVNQQLVNVVVQKESNKVEQIDYKKEVIKDASMLKGDTKVRQKGRKGQSELTFVITEENGQQKKKILKAEKIIRKPVKSIAVKGTKVISSKGTGHFSWPATGGYVSSKLGYRWGSMHKGIDIARPSNRKITAADNGVVISAGWDGGYGNKIVIDHKNGFKTVYAHLQSINVSAGQVVPKGASIGVMGATGDATGVHLHFEVYKNGKLQNPLRYF
ncbi:peptidoglycan DD-metalloendopeptidase family protein [Heyndrickxia sporothermodurans]